MEDLKWKLIDSLTKLGVGVDVDDIIAITRVGSIYEILLINQKIHSSSMLPGDETVKDFMRYKNSKEQVADLLIRTMSEIL